MEITNPILTGFNPDPSLCRQGEDYYIATSTFEWFPGVRIYHSRDLKNWSLVSTPLDRVSMLDMKGNPDSGGIWAPCLSYADGKFWLLYTDVKIVDSPWKNGRNFLVTAPSIEGPWSEPIPMGNGGFDPSLFHDDDGRKYYIYRPWGPRHHSNPHNTIVLQAFDPQTGTLYPTRRQFEEGFEDASGVRDLIGPERGWTSFTLQSPAAPSIPDKLVVHPHPVLHAFSALTSRAEQPMPPGCPALRSRASATGRTLASSALP